ncbi:MAG TPA: nucleotide exchange factor GrpE [Xanthobacteraceae bacterium]|nr:nucleotide exchange factor GrpE [Xanthobacteraceae bacterium]
MAQGGANGDTNEADSTTELQVDAASLVEENAGLRDQLLRALAEAENARRRAERAVDDVRQYGISDFARELLVVADNLQRTIAAIENHASATAIDTALIEGVRATERVLTKALERFGVRRIPAVGERFDPTRHEAVMEVEDASRPAGTVTSALEDGYTIHNRLLRPARVAVAKSPAGIRPSAEPAGAVPQLP